MDDKYDDDDINVFQFKNKGEEVNENENEVYTKDNEYDDDDDESNAEEEEEEDDDHDDDDDEYTEEKMNEQIKVITDHENNMSDDDDDDDEEDDDANYLQKFNENLKKNIIQDNHPELQYQNYEEIENLTVIVKDENGKIVDPLHRTLPFLTKYEKSRILGERANQINSGAKPFIEVEQNVIDGYLIAMAELEQRKIPFIIKRPLCNGGCEYWKLKDLELIC